MVSSSQPCQRWTGRYALHGPQSTTIGEATTGNRSLVPAAGVDGTMRVYKLYSRGEAVHGLAWFPDAMVPFTVALIAPAGTLGEFNERDRHIRVSSRFVTRPEGEMDGAMQSRMFLPTWIMAHTRD